VKSFLEHTGDYELEGDDEALRARREHVIRHSATGEPTFVVVPAKNMYADDNMWKLQWHDHMLDAHPNILSHEDKWDERELHYGTDALIHAVARYRRAARKGFWDHEPPKSE